ncbi:MAG: metal dependent phosphohydrolase [Clostridia bacterium]|nr:metal dependent phosphohydrolase [Clostridia bacterium]
MNKESALEAVKNMNLLLQQNSKKFKHALQILEEEVSPSYLDTVKMLVNFLDHKDEYTKGHCERVTKLAVAIGQALDLSAMDILNLEFAALLHDIGKLAIPDDIMNKEGKLTAQEYEIIKMHPAIGYELIEDISFLDVSKKILLQHHERVDGRGYPIGLMNQQIDIMTKILSIADAYDAMTSSRPYRKDGLSQEQAIEQLELGTGSQFDKNVVDVFISILLSGEAA